MWVIPVRVRRQAGLTLIELMIALTLSLLISVALGTLVVNMSRANTELDRSSRQIENGRYAIDLLAEDIRVAGYYGDLRVSAAVYTEPNPCNVALSGFGWAAVPITVPVPIEGRTGTGDVPACVVDHVANTDILVLRRLNTAPIAAAAATAANAYVQTSHCALDPYSPPLILSDNPADLTLMTRACSAPNVVRRYLNRIYFVAPCSDCGRDTIPTLKRLEPVGGAMQETALAEGIQEIQYEYGFDLDGNGTPDDFRTARDGVAGSLTNNWTNVMAVRIWLMSRSTEITRGYTDTKVYSLGPHGSRGPFNDGFKRRVYTTLVRLNNPAGLRE
jgi:type IV pilus assembly protein PilW